MWDKFGREYRGRVRGELLGRGTATVHPVATWMSSRMKRSRSPLAVCFSTGLLERWAHVDGAVGDSWKYDLEAQCGWGGKKTVSHRKSRRPCIILNIQTRSPRILLRARKKSSSRLRAVSHGTLFRTFANFTASSWTLSSAWQSRERMGEDACIAYSRRGRIKALYNGMKILGVGVAKDSFRLKSIPWFFW